MDMINGLKVIIAPDYPRMKLSESIMVTDSFRRETNAWLIEIFGVQCLIPDGVIFTNPLDGTIHMSQRTYLNIKAKVSTT